MDFMVETSARHLHVTREVLDILFGKGYELEVQCNPISLCMFPEALVEVSGSESYGVSDGAGMV